MCGKHITIGAIILVVVAIATAIILPNIMQYTNDDLSLLIPAVLLLVGLTALIISINRYIENPTKRLINWIIEKGKLKIGILIILISLLAVIALGYIFAFIQLRLYYPDEPFPPINIGFLDVVRIFISIIYTLITIFLGVLFVHLGFPKEKRKHSFRLLLKCSLYFFLLGVPFIYAKIPSGVLAITPNQPEFQAFITISTPITGIIPAILQWLRYMCGQYSITFSGTVNFAFFVSIFIIYLRLISVIYTCSIRESFTKLFAANFIIMTIWLMISLSLKSYAHPFLGLKIFAYQIFPVFKSIIMP